MVDDESALLQAIQDDPKDDAPRLVYADWLEEHGDAARSEFIRVQCALALPRVARLRRQQLQAREQELLEAHRERWLRKLWRSPLPWVFHRGFVERLGDGGAFRTRTQRYKDEIYCNGVRFFADGHLLRGNLCPAPETADELLRRLQRPTRSVQRAEYTLRCTDGGITVAFKIPVPVLGPKAATRYEGEIRGKTLHLRQRHARSRTFSAARSYVWASFEGAR
jgi:uncharacterized protein (TIGR02996 family)